MQDKVASFMKKSHKFLIDNHILYEMEIFLVTRLLVTNFKVFMALERFAYHYAPLPQNIYMGV